jgi:predicted sulfurtransferase
LVGWFADPDTMSKKRKAVEEKEKEEEEEATILPLKKKETKKKTKKKKKKSKEDDCDESATTATAAGVVKKEETKKKKKDKKRKRTSSTSSAPPIVIITSSDDDDDSDDDNQDDSEKRQIIQQEQQQQQDELENHGEIKGLNSVETTSHHEKKKKKKKKDKKQKKKQKSSSTDSNKQQQEQKEQNHPEEEEKGDSFLSIQESETKKKIKKEKKQKKKEQLEKSHPVPPTVAPPKSTATTTPPPPTAASTSQSISTNTKGRGRIVLGSAMDDDPTHDCQPTGITLLLFYQYMEPLWSEETYQEMLATLHKMGIKLQLKGRMRVAYEGLNCTLTGRHQDILDYCYCLVKLRPLEFQHTEFKLTTDLPPLQQFKSLKVFPVVELVHYGLEGTKAPPISQFGGIHLEPKDYHAKLAEPNTVIIDVRNHYEAAIGRFVPPATTTTTTLSNDQQQQQETATAAAAAAAATPPKWLDPKMRKSTEFPVWLDKVSTRDELRGKQVLMYCTGGIRCERASALLKYKMETDETVKDLGITGVFQLQGGIDKYFKEFPDGGYWQGKNYVFDKRFAHTPGVSATISTEKGNNNDDDDDDGDTREAATATTATVASSAERDSTKVKTKTTDVIMGQCEACHKPWDMYRGKRRCPTCGVPSLICKDCWMADKDGTRKLKGATEVRCDLCVEQGITSKRKLKDFWDSEIQTYEQKQDERGLLRPLLAEEGDTLVAPNPDDCTRLYLKNMCRKNMTQEALLEYLPNMTHIVWRQDRTSGQFLGQAWVEVATALDAAKAVAHNGKWKPFGRPLYVSYQPPDGKDLWPPPSAAIR